MKSKILQSISMISENTVMVVFKDDITFDLEGIKMSYAEYDAFTKGKRLKRLVVSGKKTHITKEARKYGEMENERRKDNCIAEAMIVYTLIQKMITNFYLKFIRDSYPAKSFIDIEEAKIWLLNFEE